MMHDVSNRIGPEAKVAQPARHGHAILFSLGGVYDPANLPHARTHGSKFLQPAVRH